MFLDLNEYDESAMWRTIKRAVHRGIILFLVSVSLISQLGCNASDRGSSGSSQSAATNGDANLVVRLTDAPFPYDSIVRADVTITSVLAFVQGPGTNRLYEVSNQEVNLNLLDLRGGVSALLVKTRVPNGTISQMRLMVSKASVTLKDGRVFDLQTPSADASGLKLFVDPPLEIRNGEVGELMFDFDVSKSFVIQGNANTPADIKSVLFKPVIRVGNACFHGTISGSVYSDSCTPNDESDDLPLNLATVRAYPSSGETAMTGTGALGQFIFFGLNEGLYRVKAEASAHAAKELMDVEIVKANNSNVGRITLAKNCNSDGGGSGGNEGNGGNDGTEDPEDPGTSTDPNDPGTSTDPNNPGTSTDPSVGDPLSNGGSTTDPQAESGGPVQWSVLGFDATSQATSMQIFWQSAAPTVGKIYIGLGPASLDFRVIDVTAASTNHVVFIEDLTPNTTYYLKVVAQDSFNVIRESAVIVKATKSQ